MTRGWNCIRLCLFFKFKYNEYLLWNDQQINNQNFLLPIFFQSLSNRLSSNLVQSTVPLQVHKRWEVFFVLWKILQQQDELELKCWSAVLWLLQNLIKIIYFENLPKVSKKFEFTKKNIFCQLQKRKFVTLNRRKISALKL
jgi:hypothetical protein